MVQGTRAHYSSAPTGPLSNTLASFYSARIGEISCVRHWPWELVVCSCSHAFELFIYLTDIELLLYPVPGATDASSLRGHLNALEATRGNDHRDHKEFLRHSGRPVLWRDISDQFSEWASSHRVNARSIAGITERSFVPYKQVGWKADEDHGNGLCSSGMWHST